MVSFDNTYTQEGKKFVSHNWCQLTPNIWCQLTPKTPNKLVSIDTKITERDKVLRAGVGYLLASAEPIFHSVKCRRAGLLSQHCVHFARITCFCLFMIDIFKSEELGYLLREFNI